MNELPKYDKEIHGSDFATELLEAIVGVTNKWVTKVDILNTDLYEAMAMACLMYVEHASKGHEETTKAYGDLINAHISLLMLAATMDQNPNPVPIVDTAAESAPPAPADLP